MKKILTILAMASVVLASCNKNQPPVFDDSKAFIAFGTASTTIAEQASTEEATIATLSVSLASVAGLEGAATYKIIADTVTKVVGEDTTKIYPIEGVNYKVLTEGGTLKFDAKNRTQKIQIQALYYPEYTGDLSLRVVIESKTFALGYQKEHKVVISDVDHPLTFMLGSYTTTAPKASKAIPYTMDVLKDAKDDHKVWFNNLFNNPGWAADDMLYYGIVNDDKTTVTIPFGQAAEYKYSGTYPMMLYGIDGPLSTANLIEKGNLVANISTDASGNTVLTFDPSFGVIIWVGDINGDYLGYLCYVEPGIVATKN